MPHIDFLLFPYIAQEMFGSDMNIHELKVVCDELYIVNPDKTIRPLDSKGQYALFRHVWNQKGEESSTQARSKNIDEIGVLHNIREPPWVIAASNGNPEHFDGREGIF